MSVIAAAVADLLAAGASAAQVVAAVTAMDCGGAADEQPEASPAFALVRRLAAAGVEPDLFADVAWALARAEAAADALARRRAADRARQERRRASIAGHGHVTSVQNTAENAPGHVTDHVMSRDRVPDRELFASRLAPMTDSETVLEGRKAADRLRKARQRARERGLPEPSRDLSGQSRDLSPLLSPFMAPFPPPPPTPLNPPSPPHSRPARADGSDDLGTAGGQPPVLVAGTASIGKPPEPPAWSRVYEAWDAMVVRAGLPGPVTRNNARKQAILRQLTTHGMFIVLGAIEAVAKSEFLSGRKKAGQGSFWGSFDWVFEVSRRSRDEQIFLRIVEGNYGPPVPRTAIEATPASTPAVPRPARVGEPAEISALRAGLRAAIGATSSAAWIDSVEFAVDGPGELMIFAPSAYHAEQVEARYRHQIERAAGAALATTVTLFFRVTRRVAAG